MQKRITLSRTLEHEYVLMSSTKDQVENVVKECRSKTPNKEGFDFDIDDVHLVGRTNQITEMMCKQIIPQFRKGYKCFVIQKDYHDSASSAFICALNHIGKPEYAIIFKIKHNGNNNNS